MQNPLTIEQVRQLGIFDTCVIADAIESFGVRLRNEGFATTGIHSLFKSLPSMVGYAATCTVRSADPPIVGSRYVQRTDWLKYICGIPAPRVVVLQDLDDPPAREHFSAKCTSTF